MTDEEKQKLVNAKMYSMADIGVAFANTMIGSGLSDEKQKLLQEIFINQMLTIFKHITENKQ